MLGIEKVGTADTKTSGNTKKTEKEAEKKNKEKKTEKKAEKKTEKKAEKKAAALFVWKKVIPIKGSEIKSEQSTSSGANSLQESNAIGKKMLIAAMKADIDKNIDYGFINRIICKVAKEKGLHGELMECHRWAEATIDSLLEDEIGFSLHLFITRLRLDNQNDNIYYGAWGWGGTHGLPCIKKGTLIYAFDFYNALGKKAKADTSVYVFEASCAFFKQVMSITSSWGAESWVNTFYLDGVKKDWWSYYSGIKHSKVKSPMLEHEDVNRFFLNTILGITAPTKRSIRNTAASDTGSSKMRPSPIVSLIGAGSSPSLSTTTPASPSTVTPKMKRKI